MARRGGDDRRDLIRLREVAVLAEHSSCVKKHVGAKVYRNVDKTAVGEGYNGTPRGVPNCSEHWEALGVRVTDPDFRERHHQFADTNEIHAEMNALLECAGRVRRSEECTMYCTHAPCGQCAKHILAVGYIRRVVFSNLYHRDTGGVDLLLKHGISVQQLPDPSRAE